jgi:hypothetical protein
MYLKETLRKYVRCIVVPRLLLISPIDGVDYKNVKSPAMLLTAVKWQRKNIELDLLVVMATVRQTPD